MGRPRTNIGDFLSNISPSPEGCWLWTGTIASTGYGQISLLDKSYSAPRVMLELTHGEIAKGFSACHTCDNRRCVNPDHLFTGTQMDNNRDMKRKNRHFRVLRLKDVTWIRRNYVAGTGGYGKKAKCGQRGLARKFGVGKSTIAAIVYCRTWKGEEDKEQ